jgi:hypothetical protein
MTNEVKPARQRVTPSFAKWEAPAKFLRQSPPEHRNIPFVEDKDYIRADPFDRAVARALGFGVLVVIGVTIWEWLQ